MASRVHAVSYDWEGNRPHLNCYDPGSREMTEPDLWHTDMTISGHSVCVGSWPEGEYRPCPDRARVSGGSVCRECASEFLPVPECMFEPLCDGEICASRFCRQEHAVYLAFHGGLAKVGMTASRRIGRRMREQGCDAFSVLARVDGRASARRLEARLAEKLVLRQRIRAVEALANMTAEPPAGEMEERFADIAGRLEGMGLRPGPLTYLDDYPLETPLASMPVKVGIGGRHRGRTLGMKGRFLVYESRGLKALDMAGVPGRFITAAQRPARP